MQVLFVKKSGNAKTGPIPVTTQESSTCPTTCPHQGKGCYPRFSHAGKHWRDVDAGLKGGTWEQFLEQLKALKPGQLWRYGVAGDLPGKGNRINKPKLDQLVEANQGKDPICYTHKPLTKSNQQMIKDANERGFTINLSADGPKEADKKMSLMIGPVVMTMPEDRSKWPKFTEDGHRVVPCPAVTHDKVTCSTCKLCANGKRRTIIGFPAHGTGRKLVEKVYFSK